jgi:hypothetical protein
VEESGGVGTDVSLGPVKFEWLEDIFANAQALNSGLF